MEILPKNIDKNVLKFVMSNKSYIKQLHGYKYNEDQFQQILFKKDGIIFDYIKTHAFMAVITMDGLISLFDSLNLNLNKDVISIIHKYCYVCEKDIVDACTHVCNQKIIDRNQWFKTEQIKQ